MYSLRLSFCVRNFIFYCIPLTSTRGFEHFIYIHSFIHSFLYFLLSVFLPFFNLALSFLLSSFLSSKVSEDLAASIFRVSHLFSLFISSFLCFHSFFSAFSFPFFVIILFLLPFVLLSRFYLPFSLCLPPFVNVDTHKDDHISFSLIIA